MCAKIAITSDGIKSFKNDIEVTHGVKINRQRIAVGSDVENPVCIIFPNYVEEIAEGAFKNLNSLAAIYIPENVKKIGLDAFVGCTSLQGIYFGEKTTSAVRGLGDNDKDDTKEVARYNLSGQPCSPNEKGVQIIVYSDYTTKTILLQQ